MSEIKDELNNLVPSAEEDTSPKTQDEKQISDTSEIEEYLDAPKSYEEEIAKTFCELPFNWRRYLHAREEEVDKGFSDLRERALIHKWIDEIYASRSDELQKDGIKNSDEWLKKIVEIDSMMSKNPADTIKMLAASYGLDDGRNLPVSDSSSSLSEAISKELINKQLTDFVSEIDDQ